jgi:predicted nucleic acid-binding protein
LITVVDTNILLDFLNPAEPHNEEAMRRLLAAGEEGPLVIGEATFAELAASFESPEELHDFLEVAGVDLLPCSDAALFEAGRAWLTYTRRRPLELQCSSCGAYKTVTCDSCGASIRSRQHLLADFLIGGQASMQADQLLTRDDGYYRTYFPELRLA